MLGSTPAGSSVVASLFYRDAPAAIEWLCKVFGFAKHAVYPGANKTIMHSELTLGGGMIMVGSPPTEPFRRFFKHPDEIGGVQTGSINLTVNDADAVYARVQDAGAEVVADLEDKNYGGRGFSCRDPEGYIWHVGTYDPWQPK